MCMGTDQPTPKRRWRPRFSLLTLVLGVLFVGACGGLWWRWEPWYKVAVLSADRCNASFNGSKIVTVHYEPSKITVWDAGTRQGLFHIPIDEENGGVRSAHLLTPDRMLGVNRKCARIWDVRSGNRLALITPPAVVQRAQSSIGLPPFFLIRQCYVCADRQTLAVWLEPGCVGLWDIKSGRHLSWLDSQSVFERVHISADRDHLAVARSDGQVLLFAVPSQERIAVWSDHTKPIQLMCFSPDARHLFIATQLNDRVIWDYRSGTEIRLEKSMQPCEEAEFSPDGKRLVTQEEGYIFQMWDTRTGDQLAAETGTGRHGILYLSDERFMSILYQGGPNGTYRYRLWEGRTGRWIGDLDLGSAEYIGGDCFTASDQRLALSSTDNTTIYSTRDGSRLCQMGANGDFVTLDYSTSLEQMLVDRDASRTELWRRRRPEYWWGLAWLPESWIALLSGGALVVIAVRNQRHRIARPKTAEPAQPEAPR
jgi:WD40 repeat protein